MNNLYLTDKEVKVRNEQMYLV